MAKRIGKEVVEKIRCKRKRRKKELNMLLIPLP
jgi:hypothetical protein